MNAHLLAIVLIFSITYQLYPRSIFRTSPSDTPHVTARWKGEHNGHTVADNHFRQYPLFTFGTADIAEDLVPEKITFLNSTKTVITKKQLDTLIENALKELTTKKRKIKHTKEMNDFTVLQYKNFSFRRGCGLLVLKFKQYPFVLKLFIERPETFVNAHIKGMEPIFFHYMAGGVNRHISGLTRIKNLRLIKEQIAHDSLWSEHIVFPRKWYWLPQNNQEIELIGSNIAEKELQLHIPSVYAIVADYIDTTQQISDTEMPVYIRKQIVMQFSNDILTYLDPHFNNYVFHKVIINQKESYKITIVDTEHFPTIVGLEKSKLFHSHANWYAHLAYKFTVDTYFQTKRDLRKKRTVKSSLCLDNPIFYQKSL